MRTKEELKDLIIEAKDLGVESLEIDGVKYTLRNEEAKKIAPIPIDLKPEEIIRPIEEEYSDEEILYWSTGYYDEIQARKELQKKQRELDDSLKTDGENNGQR